LHSGNRCRCGSRPLLGGIICASLLSSHGNGEERLHDKLLRAALSAAVWLTEDGGTRPSADDGDETCC
jgi:hypothetical protein